MIHAPNTQPQKQKSPAPAATGRGFIPDRSAHSNSTKKQPPFANQLQGQSRVLLFVGGHDCWSLARANLDAGRDAVALPIGETAGAKNWNCARGRSVVVIELGDTGPGFRVSLVKTLAAWGAPEVFLLPASCNPADCVSWGC